jgi:translocation and assembly module TamB
MTKARVKPRRRGYWQSLLMVSLAALAGLAFLLWYSSTDSFQRMVRQRLVAHLERVTGGTVELGSIHTVPFRFQVEARNLTIHGLEAAGEVPYAHVDHLVAKVEPLSVLGGELGFKSVVLDHPVIRIIWNREGGSNQPQPKLHSASRTTILEQLFAFSIHRLEARGGELEWGDQTIPLDFVVHDLSADMTYSLLRRHYLGNLSVGQVETRLRKLSPIDWRAEMRFVLSRDALAVDSLKVISGQSQLNGRARLENFHRPTLLAAYDLRIDLGDARRVLGDPRIEGGVFEASGSGSWSAKDFSATGRLGVRDLDWRGASQTIRNASWSAQFAASPRRLSFTALNAKLLGGTWTGGAEIENWIDFSSARSSVGKKSEEQKGNSAPAGEGFLGERSHRRLDATGADSRPYASGRARDRHHRCPLAGLDPQRRS